MTFAAAGTLAVVTAGCGERKGGPATTTAAGSARPLYSPGATRACLRARGVTVTKVRPNDPRLKAVGDLAQRTSFEARFARGVVAVAFVKSASDTQLLVELLRVPNDTYRIAVQRNAIAMSRRSAAAPLATALACLRS